MKVIWKALISAISFFVFSHFISFYMKILTSQQIKSADQYTIEHEPVKSTDLMERASKTLVDMLKPRLKKQEKIMIFCGMGNNGGDGLAISRMLLLSGYNVETYIIKVSSDGSPDFVINLKRLSKLKRAKIVEVEPTTPLPEIDKNDIIIDALFGSGLNRPLEGLAAKVVKHINGSGAFVYAVDIPSGLSCEDNTANNPDHIVQAAYTFTFQLPKLSFMFVENHRFIGQWQVLDIGLSSDFIEQEETPWYFLTRDELQQGYRPRQKFDHKGKFGHALLIAGSYGKSGAAVLSARAALNMGTGLLTCHIPAVNYNSMQISVPEAMVVVDENESHFTGIKDITPYSAIAAGPGLGKDTMTQKGLKVLIQSATKPLIFDADAINILAENPTWLSFLPAGSILTPHVGEFERLAGKCAGGWERLQRAQELAFRFRCYIVLKGAHTAIVCPDKQTIFNSTGNAGMATGGSGDVLTGIILGWLAQGYSSLYSCMAGVYIHGLSADIAAGKKPLESIIASDLIFHLPKAIQKTFHL
jgi:ADP-dependent NAD(P)H-hydrate dehydratase / NAD(P)H-hydrate epimerase